MSRKTKKLPTVRIRTVNFEDPSYYLVDANLMIDIYEYLTTPLDPNINDDDMTRNSHNVNDKHDVFQWISKKKIQPDSTFIIINDVKAEIIKFLKAKIKKSSSDITEKAALAKANDQLHKIYAILKKKYKIRILPVDIPKKHKIKDEAKVEKDVNEYKIPDKIINNKLVRGKFLERIDCILLCLCKTHPQLKIITNDGLLQYVIMKRKNLEHKLDGTILDQRYHKIDAAEIYFKHSKSQNEMKCYTESLETLDLALYKEQIAIPTQSNEGDDVISPTFAKKRILYNKGKILSHLGRNDEIKDVIQEIYNLDKNSRYIKRLKNYIRKSKSDCSNPSLVNTNLQYTTGIQSSKSNTIPPVSEPVLPLEQSCNQPRNTAPSVSEPVLPQDHSSNQPRNTAPSVSEPVLPQDHSSNQPRNTAPSVSEPVLPRGHSWNQPPNTAPSVSPPTSPSDPQPTLPKDTRSDYTESAAPSATHTPQRNTHDSKKPSKKKYLAIGVIIPLIVMVSLSVFLNLEAGKDWCLETQNKNPQLSMLSVLCGEAGENTDVVDEQKVPGNTGNEKENNPYENKKLLEEWMEEDRKTILPRP